MSGVRIRYGNFAPEAKENFVPTASESAFDTLDQLQQYNLNFPNYANPCELYSVALDGMATALPSTAEEDNLGLWSEQISDDDGVFPEPIVLEMESDGQYSSQAIGLRFDENNNIFANSVNIKWYRGETLLSDMDFEPNSADYICKNQVENYNKIVITFFSINMPKNRLKLHSVDHGYGAWFYAENLKSVNVIQEVSPISAEISINTADFNLNLSGSTNLLLQKKQPISVYFNDALIATTFVKSFKRVSKSGWSIKTEDYIGLMDGIPYAGGIYEEENAGDIIQDIFSVAKIRYTLDGNFSDVKVSGFIPYTTCRDALTQVAFAIGAIVDTSNSDVVSIYPPDDTVSQEIPLSRIMQGQNFDDEDVLTAVELSAHAYQKTQNEIVLYTEQGGIGEDIFVRFNEPVWDLTIENGQINASHTNYAIIDAEQGCVLKGKRYEHNVSSKRIENPLVLASDIERVIEIQNATLVSSANLDNVLQRCYNYLAKRTTAKMRIVDGKRTDGGEVYRYGQKKYGSFKYAQISPKVVVFDNPTSVGDVISAETEYMGFFEGRIIRQSFNLNGGIMIKDSVVR